MAWAVGETSIGELRLSWFGEAADGVVDDREVVMYREGRLSGPFVLKTGDTELPRADKPSVWKSRFDVSFGNVTCILEKRVMFRSAFELRLGGSVIGKVERKSIWKSTAQANLPNEWPNALKVFILWLAMIIWRPEAAAASNYS